MDNLTTGWIAYMETDGKFLLGEGAETQQAALARAMQIGNIGSDGICPEWVRVVPATSRLLASKGQPKWTLRDGVADLA